MTIVCYNAGIDYIIQGGDKMSKDDKNYRVQQIKIKKGHRMYPYFDRICLGTKNLYNVGNFYIRQCLTGLSKDTNLTPNEKDAISLINSTIPKLNQLKVDYYNKRVAKEALKPKDKQKDVEQATQYKLLSKDNSFLSYELLEGILKLIEHPDYIALPGQVNQQVLRLLIRDWKSFFKANKDYKANPSRYNSRPKPPKYANKNGRKVATFTNQICKIKDNKYLQFPKTKLKLNIGKLGLVDGKLREVRVVPHSNYYVVEIVFELNENEEAKTMRENKLNSKPKRIVGIDLGIDNFATIANNIGKKPIIIKGKVLKSINQYYNKQRAYYYSILRQGKTQKEGRFTSKRLKRLDEKRNAKVKDFMHKASRTVIDYCITNDIDTIIIGKNEDWKRNINIGKVNNQKFVTIPYSQFIEMIEYKAYEEGIKVIITEESYTSKASFFDYDTIPVYDEDDKTKHKFSGRRIERGLYKTSTGKVVNADVNGALNIIIKVIPDAFGSRDIGFVTNPLVLSVY